MRLLMLAAHISIAGVNIILSSVKTIKFMEDIFQVNRLKVV